MRVINIQYLLGNVVTSQSLRGGLPLGILGCLSVAGILLSLLVVPKFVSIWLLQFVNSVWWFLHVVVGQLLYCLVDRECVVGAAFAGGYIKSALDEIEEEREFTEAERDALQTFADNVSAMPTHGGETARPTPMLVQKDVDDTGQLEEIRRRYRETVMSVPGYDSVYDEGFDESFTAEFGEDLGVVVKNGSQFTPPIKQMLLRQASTSVAERERHFETITAEQNSVTKVSHGSQNMMLYSSKPTLGSFCTVRSKTSSNTTRRSSGPGAHTNRSSWIANTRFTKTTSEHRAAPGKRSSRSICTGRSRHRFRSFRRCSSESLRSGTVDGE